MANGPDRGNGSDGVWPLHDAAACSGRPLAGIRVLDLSRVLAGPYCAMLLADLGADVVKIESPAGDETRRWGPPFFGESASYYFAANRNKRSVVLDLKDPAERAALDQLISVADVVISNFTADVAERLRLDEDCISAINPDALQLTISGFGPEESRRPGYDLVMQALGGLMAITGPPDGAPAKVGVAITDIAAGLFGTIAVLAALQQHPSIRENRLHVSLYDSTAALLVNQAMNWLLCGVDSGRMGSEHPNVVPYGAYATATSSLVLAIGTDAQFERLCEVLDAPELAQDARFRANSSRALYRDALRKELERLLATQPAEAWMRRLDAAALPHAEVRSVAEALSGPEARSVTTVEHPDLGPVWQVLSPIRIGDRYLHPYLAPPSLGEHTRDIVRHRGEEFR